MINKPHLTATIIPIVRALLGAAILSLPSGCTIGGSGRAGDAFDRLRRENHDLREQLDLATAQRDEHLAKLRAIDAPPLTPEAREALPRCALIEIDRLSGPSPADAPMITVYVRSLDGRRRFVQVAGTLTVHASIAGSSTEDTSSDSSLTLGPLELREAYRAGVGGTHYAVMLPLSLSAGQRSGVRLALRATLIDAVTGVTHHAERTLELR